MTGAFLVGDSHKMICFKVILVCRRNSQCSQVTQGQSKISKLVTHLVGWQEKFKQGFIGHQRLFLHAGIMIRKSIVGVSDVYLANFWHWPLDIKEWKLLDKVKRNKISIFLKEIHAIQYLHVKKCLIPRMKVKVCTVQKIKLQRFFLKLDQFLKMTKVLLM